MSVLNINLPSKSYPIYIQKGQMDTIGEAIKKIYKNKKIAIITDDHVGKLYGKKINEQLEKQDFLTTTISIKPGEQSKSMAVLEEVYSQLLDFQINRGDLIIAFGGGVVGDLAGFAAATFLRGVSFVQIPTTLLAQIDSSVGGKVAVNLKEGKNLIGNFYHPMAVFIDPNLLKTLDRRFLNDGMAEVIKYGAIRDEKLFRDLMSFDSYDCLFDHIEQIIETCCAIKGDIVGRDELDKGERMLLNFGHTLGHGIEKYYNYEKYTHGEGVAMGMYAITKKSEGFGITKEGTADLIKNILIKYQLPHGLPPINEQELIHTLKLDKKVIGEDMHMILLKSIGNGFVEKMSSQDMKKYLI